MVRESSNLLSLNGVKADYFKGSITNAEDLGKAVQDVQVVVHAAANTSQYATDFQHFYPTNVEATKNLLEESQKAGVKRFIYVSSANAFGLGTLNELADETSPFDDTAVTSGYAQSKHEAQKLALDFGQQHELSVVVVNPSFMLGKYDAKPSSGQILQLAYGSRWQFSPRGGKNFIHVEDVAEGITQAIGKGKSGHCYLLGNENLSYDQFFQKMQKVCGYPKKIVKMPKTALSVVGQVGGIIEKATGQPVRLDPTNARLLNANNFYSPAKAIRELQLPQTPIETAIGDALDWFKENGYLS